MPSEPEKYCRICGFEDEILPWGEDGETASFELCPCCGVEHGYEDVILPTIRRYRENWLASGANWMVPELRPKNWDRETQMKNIPERYI